MNNDDLMSYLFRILIPTIISLVLSVILGIKSEFILFIVALLVSELLLRRFFPTLPLFNSILLMVAYVNVFLYILYIVLRIGWVGDLSRFTSIGIGLAVIVKAALKSRHRSAASE
ncbi:MAG: hypothetical protein ACOZCE_05415 [Spirochaetota bacterium]